MNLKMPVVLEAVEAVSPDVRAFVFRHAKRNTLPGFEAGAHVAVYLPGDVIRHYSICSDPADLRTYRLAVLLEPDSRGGSRAMHALAPGDRLYISYPRNKFPLRDGAAPVVLVAGGIGITPLLAMAYRLKAQGRPFRVLFLGREEQRLPFLNEIAALAGAENVAVHCDGGDPGRRFNIDAYVRSLPADCAIYACGPGPLLDALARAGAQWGRSVELERFSGVVPTGPDKGAPFDILLARDGRRLTVGAQETAIDVLAAAGIDVPNSCRGGVCGECKLPYLDGAPVHADMVLRPDERDTLWTACVSRAEGTIKLDL